MKWHLIIIAILLLPIVNGAVQIQISTDNVTWESIDSTTYGGNVDDTNKRAYVHTISSGTEYYYRAKNSTTSWYYFTKTTNEGLDSMSVSLIGGIGIIVALLFWLAFKLDEEHGILKLLLIFSGVSLLILIPASLINPTTTDTTFLTAFTWIIRLFWLYVGGYFVYYILKKLNLIVNEDEEEN